MATVESPVELDGCVYKTFPEVLAVFPVPAGTLFAQSGGGTVFPYNPGGGPPLNSPLYVLALDLDPGSPVAPQPARLIVRGKVRKSQLSVAGSPPIALTKVDEDRLNAAGILVIDTKELRR